MLCILKNGLKIRTSIVRNVKFLVPELGRSRMIGQPTCTIIIRNMVTVKEALMLPIGDTAPHSGDKITVVGVGAVGMATAFSLLTQGVTSDLVIMDVMQDKMIGEVMDLQHGSLFLQNACISASKDYKETAGSKICIVTAGVRQKVGESRLNLVQRNVEVLKGIIPNLVKHSPDTILLVVSNPCDILTWVAWKLSCLPKHRVIGSGTNLDTSRFRYLISKRLGISSSSVHGWVIGEHGDSSVPVWSGVNVAGVRLRDINPCLGTEDDEENWNEVHKEVVDSAYKIIKLKGYTNWAIGLGVSAICSSILRNTNNIHAVSTLVTEVQGVEKDVFLSLPAALGADGITNVILPHLNETELKQFQKSATLIHEIQKGIVL